MTLKHLILATILISTWLASAHAVMPGTVWKKTKVRNKVTVYRGDVPNSKIVAFRGIGIIDASMAKVLTVINDQKRIKEWMSDLKETRIVKQISETHRIEYNLTSTPWPLKNRDFVYYVKWWVSADKKTFKIKMGPATDPSAPVTKGVVRGDLKESEYILKSIENGTKTEIMVEINADPKGAVPKWIVNIFQSIWPSNTIAGIRDIATEDGYQTDPTYAKFFATK